MENKRLSLADFKISKLESKNEIDKLLGGAAAACHVTQPDCPDGTCSKDTSGFATRTS